LSDSVSNCLQLLVIQATSLCNLNCKYCYVPQRNNASRLEFRVLKKLFEVLIPSQLIRRQKNIDVLWHAGEPLAAGIEYYQQAIEIIDQTLGGRWTARHSMQTNGTLLTSEWCDFFSKQHVEVGVSLDGPQAIHDEHRPTVGGRGSFDRAMLGVKMLRDHGISVSALCVLTPTSLRQPDQIFDFFLSEGIMNLAFNVEETEGAHQLSSLLGEGGLSRTKSLYSSFMHSIFRRNKAAGFPLQIREFQALAQHIKKRRRWPSYVPFVAEQSLGAILTMTRTGLITSWSPELASAAPRQLDKLVLGDVSSIESVDELFATDCAKAIQAEIDSGVAQCRSECKYFAVCGGGSPSNKFFEHGTFASTQTLQCTLHTQMLTEVLLSELTCPQRLIKDHIKGKPPQFPF
jgi:uncharacterized protein